MMASSLRPRSSLERHRRLAVAASLGAAWFSCPWVPSLAPPAAFAFSHPHHGHVAASNTRRLLPSHVPSAVGRMGSGLCREKAFASASCEGLRPVTALDLRSKARRHGVQPTALPSGAADDVESSENPNADVDKSSSTLRDDLRNILTLVGAQSLLVPLSLLLARTLHLPNRGLGLGFEFTSAAFVEGLQWTAPLFITAGIMRLIEPYSPALQGVTKATQRSVLAVMGKERRPVFALVVSILLGSVAGWGEEWLFRGIFQTALSAKCSSGLALGLSGLIFGLLHAVTPVYALLAGAASVFFGYLYNVSQNLAVPMICHAVYDVGALMWAHWSVTGLGREEQESILESGPGAPIMDASLNQ